MASSTTSNRHPALAACESNSADARRSFAQAKLDARLQPLPQQQQARKPKMPIRLSATARRAMRNPARFKQLQKRQKNSLLVDWGLASVSVYSKRKTVY